MEEIKLGDEIILYKVKYKSNFTKEKTTQSILRLIELQPEYEGSDAFTYSKHRFSEIDEIEKKGVDICLEILKKENKQFKKHNYDTWVNRVRAQNPVQAFALFLFGHPYHNHNDINENMQRFTPTYTYIYYLQMPDNLKDDEGHLVLKDSKGNVFSVLPEEGEFLIHKSNIDHYPKEANSSSVDRLVIAGNVGIE
jgi:sugar phosphate isomerase/epimerase